MFASLTSYVAFGGSQTTNTRHFPVASCPRMARVVPKLGNRNGQCAAIPGWRETKGDTEIDKCVPMTTGFPRSYSDLGSCGAAERGWKWLWKPG